MPTRDEIFARVSGTRMLLFLSVDLEGSTRLKQTLAETEHQSWRPVVMDFIEEFPLQFEACREQLHRKHGGGELPHVRRWKILGDEIVFNAEVETGAHLLCLVEAFQQALAAHNKKTAEAALPSAGGGHHHTPPRSATRLRVKGSAWVAGFPVTNAVIPTENGGYDYIGPSMDMGFRLGALATPQRLAVSVELAWLLNRFHTQLTFHFEGRTSVKGVAEGVGYPQLWIEVLPSAYLKKERLLLGRETPGTQVLLDLCGYYIHEHGAPRYLPFLIGEPGLTPLPENYENRRAPIVEMLRQTYLPEEPPPASPQPAPDQAAEAASLLNNLKSPAD